jgi:SAM-dependent methyltransferase
VAYIKKCTPGFSSSQQISTVAKKDRVKLSPLTISKSSLRLLLLIPRRKREKHYPKTDTKSEIYAMSSQDWYGHLDNKKTIENWLSENYLSENDITLPKRLDFVSSILDQVMCEGPVLELGGGASDMSAYLRSKQSTHMINPTTFIISDIAMSLIDQFFSKVCAFFKVEATEFPRISAQAELIPLTSNSCRAVIAKSAVHHFESFEKASAEIHRVLKQNGSFIFINDPISKINLARKRVMGNIDDLELGFNCRTYYLRDYLSLGSPFKTILIHIDPGFKDYVANQLVSHWGKYSIRTLASVFLMNFKGGRTILSIYLGIPLVFEYRK